MGWNVFAESLQRLRFLLAFGIASFQSAEKACHVECVNVGKTLEATKTTSISRKCFLFEKVLCELPLNCKATNNDIEKSPHDLKDLSLPIKIVQKFHLCGHKCYPINQIKIIRFELSRLSRFINRSSSREKRFLLDSTFDNLSIDV